MKKLYILILMALLSASSFAQITVTNANMPHPGDTARRTRATGVLGINYHLTGANYLWDYDTLRAQSQLIDSFYNISQTNAIYGFFFANTPFNTNKSTVASNGTAIPGFANPYNFYFLSPTVYKQTGIGAELQGIPIPTAYAKHDTIYKLPLNYGNQDSSNSRLNQTIPIGGLNLDYIAIHKRVNQVDGWGTLITPHGSYNVLRIKTHITGVDSLYIFGFQLPINVNRYEYKWLTDINEVVPVLQINTNVVFGNTETVTDVIFKDDFIRVDPTNVSTSYCAGGTYSLDYIKQGTFNATGFPGANVFRAQLSDAAGSFANPVNLGQVTSNQSGSISITIPANTPPGIGYRVRIVSTNLARTGADNGFNITIAPGPISTITSTNTTICIGDSVIMTAVADPDYNYQWQLNGTDISGATGISYTAFQSGIYTVVTTNSCIGLVSPSVTVTVNPAPVASFTGGTSGLCAGDSSLLTANVLPGYSYQWQLNGSNINGATNPTYYVTAPGNYALSVAGPCGNDISNATTVTFVSAPVSAITANGATSFCSGSSVDLAAVVDPSYTYQWQLNGTDITLATSDTYTASQTGNYTCVTTNACGVVLSNTINVAVALSPSAGITSATTDVCTGDSIMLSAQTTDASFTYQWQLNGVDINAANSSDLYATSGGNYTLVVSTSACGTATSQAVSITQLLQPTANVTATGSTSICNGDSLMLSTNTDPGYSYQWQLDGTNINGATASDLYISQAGNYNVVTTNSCGNVISNQVALTVNPLPVADFTATSAFICSGDSSLLTATTTDATYSYQWQFNGVDINGANSSDYYASVQGDYTLVVSTPLCGNQTSAPLTLNVTAQVIASFTTANNTFCNGDSVLLSANYNPSFTYQWQLNGVDINGATSSDFYANAAGDYTLFVSSASCGNDLSTPTTLSVIMQPVASISANGNLSFCAGDSVVLSAVTDPGYSYQWQLNGVDISGANADSYSANQSGIYTAVVSNTCGNIISNDITVAVTSLPVSSITAAANGGCAGDSVMLSVVADPGYTYQWQLDGTDITGATDAVFYALATGNYTCVVSTSICGSAISTPVTITIDALPVADVIINGSTFFCDGDSVVFNGTVGVGYNYQWQFNGADIIGAITPDLTAYTAGIYNLLVTNACTTVSSSFISITVIPLPDTTMSYSGSTTMCAGDSIMLSVPYYGSFHYQWAYNGTSAPSDTLNYTYANAAGTYQVTVSSTLGCGTATSTLVTVTIGQLPIVTINDATLCAPDSVLLDASSLPIGTNIQWWLNGSPIPGETNPTLLVGNSGSYQVQYWNSCDTLVSGAANITVNPQPAQPVISQNLDTLTSTPGLIYQWYLNGSIITGQSTQTLVVTQNGNYTVVVTDANGCTNVSQVYAYNSVGLQTINGSSIGVAPNPFLNSFELSFGQLVESADVNVQLISASGSVAEIMAQKNVKQGSSKLTFEVNESIAPGVYILQVTYKGTVSHSKLVKQ